MTRKRSYPRPRDALGDPPLYSVEINKLARLQESGEQAYGDSMVDKDHRLGRAALFSIGLPSFKGQDVEVKRQVSYVPPARVIPNNNEIADVMNDMTKDVVIPDEEFKLIEEARQLGWNWQRIANELQGRTAKQLMKIYSDSRSRSRLRYETRPLTTASTRLPLLRQTTTSSSLAEILAKKPIQTDASKFSLGPIPKEDALVNRRTIDRSGGDARVTLSKEIHNASQGFTVVMAHPTVDAVSIKFFEELHVVDADDNTRTFSFSLKDPAHCACFNIGEGKDGSPLLSWSNLYAFYQLPDGSKWAEHGYLYDREDLESFAKRNNKEFMHLIPNDLEPQELVKRKGRFHSRVQNIEYECWIYKDCIPEDHAHEDDDYFYKITFDPVTMAKIGDAN